MANRCRSQNLFRPLHIFSSSPLHIHTHMHTHIVWTLRTHVFVGLLGLGFIPVPYNRIKEEKYL